MPSNDDKQINVFLPLFATAKSCRGGSTAVDVLPDGSAVSFPRPIHGSKSSGESGRIAKYNSIAELVSPFTLPRNWSKEIEGALLSV